MPRASCRARSKGTRSHQKRWRTTMVPSRNGRSRAPRQHSDRETGKGTITAGSRTRTRRRAEKMQQLRLMRGARARNRSRSLVSSSAGWVAGRPGLRRARTNPPGFSSGHRIGFGCRQKASRGQRADMPTAPSPPLPASRSDDFWPHRVVPDPDKWVSRAAAATCHPMAGVPEGAGGILPSGPLSSLVLQDCLFLPFRSKRNGIKKKTIAACLFRGDGVQASRELALHPGMLMAMSVDE